MVKTIANTLYNLLDKKTGQATLSLTERMAAFRKGFIRHVAHQQRFVLLTSLLVLYPGC